MAFVQLFKGGLQYLEGGVKSGFRHVEKDQAPLPSLLQIKVPSLPLNPKPSR